MNLTDPTGMYVDAMGNYYPDADRSDDVGYDYNPLEHPAITAGMMVAPIAGVAVGASGVGAAGPGTWMAVNESMKASRLAYQVSQGGRAGQAYVVNGVRFDAYARGVLIEAKAGLASLVSRATGEFRTSISAAQKLLAQAQRQLQAAGNKAKVEWRVDSKRAADALRKLFKDNDVNVKVKVAEKVCTTGSRICSGGP